VLLGSGGSWSWAAAIVAKNGTIRKEEEPFGGAAVGYRLAEGGEGESEEQLRGGSGGNTTLTVW
jgi:hypothetical protein